ncbi:MAG TPA: hypothetical protein VJP77_04400, partial [Planctomycetota bacterium]|nr:hypothetical protein [Planctomycetota bacterium]
MTRARAGRYVGVSPDPTYAPGGESDLGLPAGDVVARVDLARIVEQLRPLIETGFAAFEDQIEDLAALQARSAGGAGLVDLEALFELYVEGARNAVDSAGTLELALWGEGDLLHLDAALELLPGSPWDGVFDGRARSLGPALRHVDTGAALAMAGVFDGEALYARLAPFTEALVAVYPEATRDPMRQAFEALQPVYADLSGPTALSLDFGETGMAIAAWTGADDGEALLEAYAAAVAPLREQELGFAFEGPLDSEVGGRAAREVRIVYGPELVAAMSGGAQTEEARAALQQLFGGDGAPVLRMVAVGDALVWGFGDVDLGQVLAPRPGGAPDVEALAERVG